MKITDFEVNKKFLFENVPCKKIDSNKKISAEIGRLELFDAEEILFKNRENTFAFEIIQSNLNFEIKNFLRQNFVAVATLSDVAESRAETFFCLRIIFFMQAVRFNFFPIILTDKFKSDLSRLGENFSDYKTLNKIFQFDDGVSENCFVFSTSPLEKILILHEKTYKFLIRLEGENFQTRAVAEKIFFGNFDDNADFNFQIGYGEINFSDAERFLPPRIEKILFNVPNYIKIWNEYAEREGDFLLNFARIVGEISFAQDFKISAGKVELKLIDDGNFDLSYLSVGDFLELRNSPPPYITDKFLTWRDLQKNFGESTFFANVFEILRKDKKTLILKVDEDFPSGGKLYYSILGDKKQIERRISARKKIESGTNAMPNLGMILGSRLENSAKSLGITFTPRQNNFPLSKILREKIFIDAEPTLNQIQAVDIAINTPDIAVIQGPPGTGKTTVIAAILERLNELSNKNFLEAGQVLITSLQHDAVQNVIDRLSINSLPTIKFSRDENSQAEIVAKLREEILKNLEKKLDALQIKNSELGIEKKIENILSEFYIEMKMDSETAEKILSEYIFAFAATAQQSERIEIKRAKNISANDSAEYDTVIVDEAARVTPGDLMIPLSQARRKIILVGDQRQLPHIYDEEIFQEMFEDGKIFDSSNVKVSMFEQLWNRAGELEKFDGIKRRITLDSQFRMHPKLGKFISENFYDAYGEGFKSPRPVSDFSQGICSGPVHWLNVPIKHGKDFRAANHSLYRPAEAYYVVKTLADIFSNPENEKLTYGVITFYREQVRAIEREINFIHQDYREKISKHVKIGTVDEFQGMEFDVIILSTVRAGRKFDDVDLEKLENPPPSEDEIKFAEYQKFVQETGKKFFGFFNDNRLCVALSRQKKLLIVVGESALFNGKISSRVAKICVPAMYNLVQLCKKERSKLLV